MRTVLIHNLRAEACPSRLWLNISLINHPLVVARSRLNYDNRHHENADQRTLDERAPAAGDRVDPRDVEKLVAESGVQEGLVLINAMHITASVFINDNEPGLHRDYDKWLEELAPFDPSPERYHHNRTGEDNADAHHKRQIMGREVVVAITDGKLHLGPWEHIFYYEFDGRRKKRVLVKIIGE